MSKAERICRIYNHHRKVLGDSPDETLKQMSEGLGISKQAIVAVVAGIAR